MEHLQRRSTKVVLSRLDCSPWTGPCVIRRVVLGWGFTFHPESTSSHLLVEAVNLLVDIYRSITSEVWVTTHQYWVNQGVIFARTYHYCNYVYRSIVGLRIYHPSEKLNMGGLHVLQQVGKSFEQASPLLNISKVSDPPPLPSSSLE